MLATVTVLLCLNGICIEKVVTDQATFTQCGGPMALQVIPDWMKREGYSARGYELAKWSCTAGRRTRI